MIRIMRGYAVGSSHKIYRGYLSERGLKTSQLKIICQRKNREN